MTEFAYHNAKNARTSPTSLELNYSYYLKVSYKENIYSYAKSRSMDKKAKVLYELISICKKNFYH